MTHPQWPGPQPGGPPPYPGAGHPGGPWGSQPPPSSPGGVGHAGPLPQQPGSSPFAPQYGPPPVQVPFGEGGGPGSGPWGPPQPPRKNRKPLIITASAATAVVLVIVVVAAVLLSSGGDEGGGAPTGAPSEVVKTYMDALARGDAKAALELGASEPANGDLLTEDILKKQIALAPIRDVQIMEETPHEEGDGVAVKVAARIGDQRTEGQINVAPVDGAWKLNSAFVDAEPSGVIDNEWSIGHVLRIFDKPLDETGIFYAFPGALEVHTTSPYIDVNKPAPLGLDLGNIFPQHPEFDISLNDRGRPAAEQAMRAWITKCYSPGPKNPPCAKLTGFEPEYDSTTIQLTAPLDLSGLKYEYNGGFFYVMVTGAVPNVNFTVRQNSDGQTVPLIVDLTIANRIDMSKDPAVVDESPN